MRYAERATAERQAAILNARRGYPLALVRYLERAWTIVLSRMMHTHA